MLITRPFNTYLGVSFNRCLVCVLMVIYNFKKIVLVIHSVPRLPVKLISFGTNHISA